MVKLTTCLSIQMTSDLCVNHVNLKTFMLGFDKIIIQSNMNFVVFLKREDRTINRVYHEFIIILNCLSSPRQYFEGQKLFG